MRSFLSVTAVAKRLGMSARRVREICQEHTIGSTLGGRTRLLTEADVGRIQRHRRPRGNPNFVRQKS